MRNLLYQFATWLLSIYLIGGLFYIGSWIKRDKELKALWYTGRLMTVCYVILTLVVWLPVWIEEEHEELRQNKTKIG